ncbi:hypothetical protein PS1_046762 [Malus domestica]
MTSKFIPSRTSFLYVSNTVKQLKQSHTLLLKAPTEPNRRYHLLAQLLQRLLQLPGDNLRYAHNLFDEIPNCRIQFLWTSLIHSNVLQDRFRQSIALYAQMHRVGVSPSGFTFSSVLNACGRVQACNAVSWATMVAGYANIGDMERAKELYERMVEKNPVAWVAMIAGYGKRGNVVEAEMVFNEIQMPDASCWAAMVACYAQNGYAAEAIEMYKKMREAKVRVSEVAMVGAISACTQLGDVEIAAALAKHVEEGFCEKTIFVSNALIHMHSKCGNIDQAWREFNRMSMRDVISYSALVTALADHGKAEDALDLFSKMQKEGVRPNKVTFIGLLNACSHAGLVEKGCRYFELMTQVFGIEPQKEHYACMVDLLGRAGMLEKAYNLIIDNVGVADAKIWGSLLGACKVHGNAELSEMAARQLFEIEPRDAGNYVLLANTYAETNKWDDAERVRMMMNQRGMVKSPGCSWRDSTV